MQEQMTERIVVAGNGQRVYVKSRRAAVLDTKGRFEARRPRVI